MTDQERHNTVAPMTDMAEVTDYTGPGRLLQLRGGGPKPPVLITHGTFSDAQTCLPLAQALAQDRDVYVIEWRGRGRSPGQFDFHDLAEGEITQALAHIPAPAHLVAHSGGGLAMCFAVLDPANRAKALSAAFMGTQATHLTEAPGLSYANIRAMNVLGKLMGTWPARLTGLGPRDETAALLSQWVAFNRARKPTTREGRDLYPLLPSLNLPVLSLAGAADLTIARPDGCRALAEAFGPSAQYHLCAQATDGEDFTHPRLIRSRAAARSVWPRIAAFHQDHDIPFASPANSA